MPEHLNIIDSEFIPIYIKWTPFFVSIFGSSLAITLYYCLSEALFKLYTNNLLFVNIYTFFNKKWFFDRLQNELLISSLLKLGYNTTYKVIDKGLIELFGPSGLTNLTIIFSKQVSILQSGKINQYAFLIFVSLIGLISITLTLSFIKYFINFQLSFIFVIYLLVNNVNFNK